MSPQYWHFNQFQQALTCWVNAMESPIHFLKDFITDMYRKSGNHLLSNSPSTSRSNKDMTLANRTFSLFTSITLLVCTTYFGFSRNQHRDLQTFTALTPYQYSYLYKPAVITFDSSEYCWRSIFRHHSTIYKYGGNVCIFAWKRMLFEIQFC